MITNHDQKCLVEMPPLASDVAVATRTSPNEIVWTEEVVGRGY